jgi:competence protein ComEC
MVDFRLGFAEDQGRPRTTFGAELQQPAAFRLAAWARLAARGWSQGRARNPGGSRSASLPELLSGLGRTLLMERDRWPLWAPVAFAAGIVVYFALPSEPSPQLLAVLAIGVAAAVAGARRQWEAEFQRLGWLALALVLAGFATAQLRTLSVDAPVLPRASVYNVEGTIRTAEPRGAGQRLLLEDLEIERIAPGATPARVRLTVRAMDPPFLPGQRVKVRARLQPPSGAPFPGGFDFAERAFFEQLGGVGFAYGHPEVVGGVASGGSRSVATLRFAIASRAETVIGGAEGAVAAALLTGLRASIPQEVWRDMQVAGLAHLLAISGLHMTLVAGTVFVACRLLLSLWPALALRVVPKKPAACVALLAAFAYLMLAGATVPTQRAFMMAGVALVAILFDRNPLSLRLLAYAALAVLLMMPESLLGPSFQMSFAAVVGLIAFYEAMRQRRRQQAPEDDPFRLRNVAVLYFTGILLTTLIASVATTPFAAYHFQRIATYGALANLVAVPMTAFWIMPMGLLALFLMPLGLDAPVLVVMGLGIGVVLEIAAFMTALPGAVIDITPWPGIGLLCIVLGGLWVCLWQTRWRHWGMALIALGILVASLSRAPDLLLDRRGDFVLWRAAGGEAYLLERNRDTWLKGQILQAAGVPAALPFLTGADGQLRCDALGCLIDSGGRRPFAIALTAEAAVEDCRRAAFVVLLGGPEHCPEGTASLGGRALWHSAGLAIWLDGERVRMRTVAETTGDRPWTR